MLGHVRNYLVLAALVAARVLVASAADVSKTSAAVTSAASLRPSICPSATVNYITHRLPQQCLRTNHTASVTTGSRSNEQTIDLAYTPSISLDLDPPSSASTHGSVRADKTTTASVDNQSVTGSTADVSASAQPDPENESPLDNVKFLSFEEWKKQNLAQAGQSAETVGQEQAGPVPGLHRQRPGSENALDSLGEDSEIELDFGFGDGARPQSQEPKQPTASVSGASAQQPASGDAGATANRQRSKDAGKTSKERFNYASFDCAANVLKTNPKCKSSSSILVENKDSYMLNECSTENKFLIVELCDLIMIDTVVLANFEFFSSMFRRFRVSVSDRYPVKIDKWREIGTYEARNSRDIQAFLVEDPPIWARHLRIEFLTHYGNEFYCPLSLLRVHGTTMFEQFRRDQAIDRGEIDPNDEDEEEQEPAAEVAKQLEPIIAEPPQTIVPPQPAKGEGSSDEIKASRTTPTPTEVCAPLSMNFTVFRRADSWPVCFAWQSPVSDSSLPTNVSESNNSSTSGFVEEVESSTTKDPEHRTRSDSSKIKTDDGSTSSESHNTETKTTESPSAGKAKAKQPPTGSTLVATPVAPPVGAVQPAAAGTQESFFKSIHKRLQALEANATLSLQYIESQSQLLRDAFAKVEKRQLNKTADFLNTLNTTVLAELSKLKGEYEQLWQSTVLELANQREEGRRDREILGERVKMLAEEMVTQRRLMAVQATILLLCLGLIVFGRINSGGQVDVGFVQSVQGLVAKANGRPQGRWRWDSPWTSPSAKARAQRPGLGHDVSSIAQHIRSASDDTLEFSRYRGETNAGANSADEDLRPDTANSAPTTPTETAPSKLPYLDANDSAQSFESLASF